MTDYLYRFLAAIWKFCMVIVTILLGIPIVEFSSDVVLLAILFAASVVLRDTPRAVQRGGVALCAAAFAAADYAAWGRSSLQGESSPQALGGIFLVLVACVLIDRATVAERAASVFAGRPGSLPDYANLGNLRGAGRGAELRPGESGSEGKGLRPPIFSTCMPDVVIYTFIWFVVSRLGVWFPSSP
jgi:hypothetical protein